MNQTDIQPLIATYHRRLAATGMQFKRQLYHQINWDARLIGIKGARGVGKTTMLLQRIKETASSPDSVLYASLDDLWFTTHRLDELADYLYTHGVHTLYLDEVHKLSDWSRVLKHLYDSYPDLHIVYTGSSILDIDHSTGDLSRRQTLYSMPGLSFREYLAYTNTLHLEPLRLSELLTEHVGLALDIAGRIRILPHFEQYLHHGYYPFFRDSGQDYLLRLQAVAGLVIESDLPAVLGVNYSTVEKTKRLLMVIAQSVPFVPNISKLCDAIETTRDNCLRMLYALDRADILHLLTAELKFYKHLVAPDKIFLGNTNLMYALGVTPSDGTLRETFFANQVSQSAALRSPKAGDFLADGRYLFEVGGPTKTFDQIADRPDSYLAIDGIETGHGHRIPLWMFGLLY